MALGASKTKREDELLTLRRKQDTADPLMRESDPNPWRHRQRISPASHAAPRNASTHGKAKAAQVPWGLDFLKDIEGIQACC